MKANSPKIQSYQFLSLGAASDKLKSVKNAALGKFHDLQNISGLALNMAKENKALFGAVGVSSLAGIYGIYAITQNTQNYINQNTTQNESQGQNFCSELNPQPEQNKPLNQTLLSETSSISPAVPVVGLVALVGLTMLVGIAALGYLACRKPEQPRASTKLDFQLKKSPSILQPSGEERPLTEDRNATANLIASSPFTETQKKELLTKEYRKINGSDPCPDRTFNQMRTCVIHLYALKNIKCKDRFEFEFPDGNSQFLHTSVIFSNTQDKEDFADEVIKLTQMAQKSDTLVSTLADDLASYLDDLGEQNEDGTFRSSLLSSGRPWHKDHLLQSKKRIKDCLRIEFVELKKDLDNKNTLRCLKDRLEAIKTTALLASNNYNTLKSCVANGIYDDGSLKNLLFEGASEPEGTTVTNNMLSAFYLTSFYELMQEEGVADSLGITLQEN